MHHAQGASDEPQQEFNINTLVCIIMVHGSLLPKGSGFPICPEYNT